MLAQRVSAVEPSSVLEGNDASFLQHRYFTVIGFMRQRAGYVMGIF